MTHKKKPLLATLLTLSILTFAIPAYAGDDHRHKNHHGGGKSHGPNYGWQEDRHDKRYDDKRYDNKHNNNWHKKRGYQYNRYNFDVHVPRHLRHARHRLPVFIVIDSKGKYRGHGTKHFFQQKAAREGFILAYAYDHSRNGHRMSNRDKDYLVHSVLSMLDNNYRPDTRRINFYFNF